MTHFAHYQGIQIGTEGPVHALSTRREEEGGGMTFTLCGIRHEREHVGRLRYPLNGAKIDCPGCEAEYAVIRVRNRLLETL